MATQLSKADQIRKLLHLSNAEIAERIGCSDAYVRAVRQRTSDSGNPIEPPTATAWKAANPERLRSYERSWLEANRERRRAYRRAYDRKRRAEARAS